MRDLPVSRLASAASSMWRSPIPSATARSSAAALLVAGGRPAGRRRARRLDRAPHELGAALARAARHAAGVRGVAPLEDLALRDLLAADQVRVRHRRPSPRAASSAASNAASVSAPRSPLV